MQGSAHPAVVSFLRDDLNDSIHPLRIVIQWERKSLAYIILFAENISGITTRKRKGGNKRQDIRSY